MVSEVVVSGLENGINCGMKMSGKLLLDHFCVVLLVFVKDGVIQATCSYSAIQVLFFPADKRCN